MPALDPQTCEVKVDGAWLAVTLPDARAHHGSAPKRCPACYGNVTTMGTFTAAHPGLRMVHARAHDGCPLMPERYRGEARMHPQAVA